MSDTEPTNELDQWMNHHGVYGWLIPLESQVGLTPSSPGKVLVEMTLIREVSNEDAQRLLDAASETMTATTLRARS